MSNLPQISGKKLTKAFQKDGWYVVGQKGSHIKLQKDLKPIGKNTIIIPNHRIIKKGTLAAILKDSRMGLEKLKKLI